MGHTAVPEKFCDGIRTAEQYYGMSYKDYLAEYALDTNVAAGIEKEGVKDALADHMSAEDALSKGAWLRAEAKAKKAATDGEYVKRGQRVLCGQESNNW